MRPTDMQIFAAPRTEMTDAEQAFNGAAYDLFQRAMSAANNDVCLAAIWLAYDVDEPGRDRELYEAAAVLLRAEMDAQERAIAAQFHQHVLPALAHAIAIRHERRTTTDRRRAA